MKAVIMAGGQGSRLRPLTCDIPKPMARLCGRPILEYILELLDKNGFEEAALTLGYLPDRIMEHFPDRVYGGVALEFVEEKTPLGTAGGVKNTCQEGQEGHILVISGDAMCDFDLKAFYQHHIQQGADVSILGTRVADPREYGLIDMDDKGRIVGFIEKPAFSQAVSDMANTGIYLLSPRALSLIPRDRSYDFAKDLFPKMLELGMVLSCWEGKGYWCDIGDLDSYIQCQRDMLEGKITCHIKGERDGAGNIYAGSRPGSAVAIQPPVYIGRHVSLEEQVVLERGTVVDDGSFVGRGARITGSVLLQDAYVGRRAKLTGSLVCGGATVKVGAMLFEGATVGSGAVVGEHSTIHPGVKIWNNKRVSPASIVTTHIKTSAQSKDFFGDNGITGQIGVELTPEFCARMGAAVGSLVPGARVAVGCSNHPAARVLAGALCAGIQSCGTHVVDFGDNFEAQFIFSMNFCNLPVGVFVGGDSRACIKVLGPGGLPAVRDMERNIEGILSRGEFARCAHDEVGDRVEMPGMASLYRSQLIRCAAKGLEGCAVQVRCSNIALKSVLKDALYRMGCDTENGITLEISAQGDKVRIFDPQMGYVPHHKIFTWCAMDAMQRGEDIAVPFDAPQVIDEIGRQLGRRVLRYFDCPADNGDSEARKLAKNQLWSRDALMQTILFLHMARNAGGIGHIISKTPSFDRQVRTVDTTGNPAALLSGLGGELRQPTGGRVSEGVLVQGDLGVALVRPLKRGTGIKIFAEAVSAEVAAELCDDIERRIRERMGPTA